MDTVFWLSMFLIIYPYIIYPGLLYILPKKKYQLNKKGETGPVAIVCSLYNEEKVICSKIDNFYNLDYPEAELYLGLDGCTDNTFDEIKKAIRDHRVKVYQYSRRGKINVINTMMCEVNRPFVVMTDANCMFRPDAINALMEHLNNGVGVVCGRLILTNERGTSGEGLYWRLETFIKRIESKFGSVMGANGAIYLFRRGLFEPPPSNTINDDFSISMRIYERGNDMVYADNAIAEEKLVTTDLEEFSRHVRDGAGHFRAMVYFWRLLNPMRVKRFFFYVSHRVLRWMVPFLLILAIIANGFLAIQPSVYRTILIIHLIGYFLIGVVHFFGIRRKLLYLPYYFILINVALLVGFFKNILGFQKTAWDSTRR